MPDTVSPLIAQARKHWTRAAEAEDAQRKAILLAKEFRALKQWPDAIRLAREGAGSIAGQPPQPARPCLVMDRLSPAVRNITNQIKNADFGFNVLPNGGGANNDTAEILKGYLRRVQNQSRGESPIEWAADGAVEGGLGWARLTTDYVHQIWEGDPDDLEAYDQELRLKRVANSLSVYCDPSATHPTRADALFMFVVQDMDRDAFTDRFPDANLRGLEEFQSTGDMGKAWVSKDVIRVAEYWRVTHQSKTISTSDGKYTRTMRIPIVKGSLINAVQELEPFPWVGRRIPLFPILGEELNVDGKIVLRGVIGPGMDAQRMVNYTFSGAVEIYALGYKSPFIVPAAAVAQYKPIWDTANQYNYSYLPYDEYDDQGHQFTKPYRDQAEAPIQAAVELMKIAEDSVKFSTITGDASLGNTNPNERSGRALEALQAQSELGNSNYAANVKTTLIDIADEALYIIPKITRPGQILHIMGLDDEPKQVMIGKPFTVGPDGRPVEAPPHITPELAQAQDSIYKIYDPAQGRYANTVTIGKASATRQQEGSKALGELIPHLPPEMAAVIMPDYVKQLSFPGAQGIAERLESTLPPNLRPQKPGDQNGPEQQQIQQLTGQLQQLQQALESKQVEEQAKQQAQIRIAEIKAQSDERIADKNNAAKLEAARITVAKEPMNIRVEAAEERLSTGLEIAGDLEKQAREHAHEAALAAVGHGAEADAQAAVQAHTADMKAADHQHAAQTQAEKLKADAETTAAKLKADAAKAAAKPKATP